MSSHSDPGSSLGSGTRWKSRKRRCFQPVDALFYFCLIEFFLKGHQFASHGVQRHGAVYFDHGDLFSLWAWNVLRLHRWCRSRGFAASSEWDLEDLMPGIGSLAFLSREGGGGMCVIKN